MGLIDTLLGRKTDNNAESRINSFNESLKEISKNATTPEEKATLEKAKEMKKDIDAKYKEIKQIKDQATFNLRAHHVADMAMYAKFFIEQSDKQRWQYVFDDRKREVDFIRPDNEQDIEYRKHIIDTISTIAKTLDENSGDLGHSTSRANAESIIRNLSLSSSADRYDGYDASTDGRGRISVADYEGMVWSASYWLHTTSQHEPCGVMFILKENHEGDFDKSQHQMDSVDFKKNPEQLKFVLSSPENMESLKQTMKESGLNPDIVITFEQYLEKIRQKDIEKSSDEQSKEVDVEKIIEGIEDPDKKYQARQVLLKLESQGQEKIDIKQFDFEKDSAKKIQLILQGQMEFGKENTECYKELSDKQITKLRSIQLLQQRHPDKISIQDIVDVSQAGDSKAMEKAIIKIAQREEIEEIPNIQTNKKANDTIQQRPPSLDSIIKSKSIDSKEQDRTEQQRQNNDPTR